MKELLETISVVVGTGFALAIVGGLVIAVYQAIRREVRRNG